MGSIPKRYIMGMMCFLGMFQMYFSQLNINIAILAMADASKQNHNASLIDVTCPENVNYFSSGESSHPLLPVNESMLSNESQIVEKKEFTMSNIQQMNLIGFYYHGYVSLHIVSSVLSLRYGFKKYLMVTSVIGAILTFAFPMMIRMSYTLGLITRIILGSLHSGWFPALSGAWGAWAPEEEKCQLIMTGFVGAILGSTGVTSTGGVIVAKYGWPALFYISAVMTLLWAITWFFLVFDSPKDHPTITESERKYIEHSLPPPRKQRSGKELISIYSKLCKSRGTWVYILGEIGSNFLFYLILNLCPKYFKERLNLELEQAGFLASLPTLGHGLGCIFFATLSDWLSKKYSVRASRRIFAFLGFFIGGGLFFLIIVIGCSVILALIIITIGMILLAFQAIAVKSNPNDLAPEYAGLLSGLANTAANNAGSLTALMAGFLFDTVEDNKQAWNYIFIYNAGIALVSGIIFIIFVQTERFEWTKRTKDEELPPKMETSLPVG